MPPASPSASLSLLHASHRRRLLSFCFTRVLFLERSADERDEGRSHFFGKKRGRVKAEMRPVKHCIQMCERSKKKRKEKTVERVFVI